MPSKKRIVKKSTKRSKSIHRKKKKISFPSNRKNNKVDGTKQFVINTDAIEELIRDFDIETLQKIFKPIYDELETQHRQLGRIDYLNIRDLKTIVEFAMKTVKNNKKILTKIIKCLLQNISILLILFWTKDDETIDDLIDSDIKPEDMDEYFNDIKYLVETALSNGLSLNTYKDDGGNSQLMIALEKNVPYKFIKMIIINGGADVLTSNNYGDSTLIYYFKYRIQKKKSIDINIVKLLRENDKKNSLINRHNRGKDTALSLACLSLNYEVVEYLIKEKHDIMSVLNSPIIEALKKLNLTNYDTIVKLMNLLLEKNADVNARLTDGTTPLLFVLNINYIGTIEGKEIELLELLLKNGADIFATNNKKQMSFDLIKENTKLTQDKKDSLSNLLIKYYKIQLLTNDKIIRKFIPEIWQESWGDTTLNMDNLVRIGTKDNKTETNIGGDKEKIFSRRLSVDPAESIKNNVNTPVKRRSSMEPTSNRRSSLEPIVKRRLSAGEFQRYSQPLSATEEPLNETVEELTETVEEL